MPKYTALKASGEFSAFDLELSRSLWTTGTSFIEYTHQATNALLRVTFKKAEIIRIVDDLALLDEEDDSTEGVGPKFFGYSVVGAAFWKANAATIAKSEKPMTHYRFITLNSSVDIIASSAPHFRTLAVAS